MSTFPDASTRRTRPALLSVREGRRLESTEYEGVPAHLEPHVRGWLHGFLGRDLERRVALQVGVQLTPRGVVPRTIDPPQELSAHPDVDLLDAIDVALRLDHQLRDELDRHREDEEAGVADGGPIPARLLAVVDLMQMLEDARSVYTVARDGAGRPQLVRRVDPTMQTALDQAVADADPTAGSLLGDGWSAAYSRTPDPTTSYRDSVRAVETVARPLVLPDEPGATLGKVNAHLRQAGRKWELVLLDKNGDGSVGPLLGMLERLWEGQVSRHGGGPRSRDQTVDEARAAVALAVTCVQWLTAGYLRRRDDPDASTS